MSKDEAIKELRDTLQMLLRSHRQLSFIANNSLTDTPIEEKADEVLKRAGEIKTMKTKQDYYVNGLPYVLGDHMEARKAINDKYNIGVYKESNSGFYGKFVKQFNAGRFTFRVYDHGSELLAFYEPIK